MAESTAVLVETATTEVGVVIANTTVVGTVSASVQVAGGVTSVNGETGVVVLSAADVSADPAGTAATAVAAEAVTRAAADTALDGRVDTLEAVTPLLSVVAGDNVTIDDTDPQNPIISAEAGGGGSGVVETVVAGPGVSVDSTDPANPIVTAQVTQAELDAEASTRGAADTALDGRLDTLEAISIATDAELAAEAALARNADNLTSGTVADARIPSTIARDTEVTAAASAAQAAAEATAAADATAKADAKVAQTITNGVTTSAPSQDAVFDALANKQPLDGDLTALAGAGNSAVLAATTASFTTADETKLDGLMAGFPVVNIADHGAVGDGVTNDTAAIAAAIAAAESDEALIYIPAGTFLSDPIDASGIPGIIGTGKASVLKLRTQDVSLLGDHAVVQAWGSSGTHIPWAVYRDFKIDGNKAAVTGATSLDMEGLNLKYVDGGIISGVFSENVISDGFDLDHSTDVVLIGNTAKGCGGNGFHMSNGSLSNLLLGNLADDCGDDWSRSGFDQYDGSSPEANRNRWIGNVARDCYRNWKVDGALAVAAGNVSEGSTTVGNTITASSGQYDPFGSNALVVDANTQTDSYTLVLTDAGKVIEMGKGTAQTLTVPPNSSVAFGIGTVIEVYQSGAGTLTIAEGSGVTVRNVGDLAGQFASATLRKRATDEWVLAGSMA